MTAMENCCPTCGGQLHEQVAWSLDARTFIASGKALRFTPTEANIIDIFWRSRHSGGIDSEERLMAAVYRDDPEGGPESSGSLHVTLVKLRKKLSEIGYTITLNVGRPRAGYRLVPLVLAELPARRA